MTEHLGDFDRLAAARAVLGRRVGHDPGRASWPTRDYVQLVSSGVDHAEEISVVQSLLRQACAALGRFTDPVGRQHGTDQAEAPAQPGRAAAPGSDHQFA